MQSRISVLLVEHEPEVISLVSLSLSDMKECDLKICSSISDVRKEITESRGGLLLLNVRTDPAPAFEILNEVRANHPNIYVIVSLPEISEIHSDSWMASGAYDCVIKDRNYVANIVRAVKTALVRIAEREAIHAPLLSRAQHFALDENLPDVIFSLDLEGKILYANFAVAKMLGFQQNEVVGKYFSEFISEMDAQQQFYEYLDHIFERINFRKKLYLNDHTGSPCNFEINFTLIEGEMIYGVAHKDPAASPIGFPSESFETPASVVGIPEEPIDPDVLPAKVGPYRIITLLGAGAMGRVYKGFDEQLERYVAIKVTSKALDEQDRNLDRFKKEARILASISHPNIALIYYFGSLEGMPYFCMEYLPNGSVENLLQMQNVIDPHLAISYVSQAAAGLREAVAKGVLHMDVKPSNLMLTEDGRLKIVDFGLAHTNRDMDELERNIIGTPVYIAPEQIIGGSVDHRMDIYSLGITFFEMLYGFVPFKGKTVPDIFHQKLRVGIPPRSELNTSISPALYDLVVKMTAREPSQRIAHYSELIEALESLRRTSVKSESIPAPKKPAASNVAMSGLLYDRSVPEVLGQIAQERLTGKLTINWGQLFKQLHFKKGKLIAILSNQEGEDFVDLVISHLPADVKAMRKLQTTNQSMDLYQGYTTVLQKIPKDMRSRLSKDFEARARMILENLFSWLMGEYMFETGDYPGQLDLEIQIQDMISQAVRQGLDFGFIRRKLFEGNCTIRQVPDFVRLLREVNLPPSDRFLLFRFEKEIAYKKLLEMSRISEEEFGRLLFLFHCLGLVRLEKTALAPPSQPAEPPQVPEPDSRPAVDPGVYYTHCAIKSFEQSNYFACVEYCKKALEHRQDPGVYRLMGKALASNPKFLDEAMQAYKKALSLTPGNPAIERDLSDLRLRQSGRK